jgi:hypothetical protein
MLAELQRLGKHLNSMREVLLLVIHRAQLIEYERIGRADVRSLTDVLLRLHQVVRTQVLHANVQQREVRSREQAGRSPVRRHGLVALILRCERVPETDPRRSVRWLDRRRFAVFITR